MSRSSIARHVSQYNTSAAGLKLMSYGYYDMRLTKTTMVTIYTQKNKRYIIHAKLVCDCDIMERYQDTRKLK